MCEVCEGMAVINQYDEDRHRMYKFSRYIDDDCEMHDYFEVEECDDDGVTLFKTFTPDMYYCPHCGKPL